MFPLYSNYTVQYKIQQLYTVVQCTVQGFREVFQGSYKKKLAEVRKMGVPLIFYFFFLIFNLFIWLQVFEHCSLVLDRVYRLKPNFNDFLYCLSQVLENFINILGAKKKKKLKAVLFLRGGGGGGVNFTAGSLIQVH